MLVILLVDELALTNELLGKLQNEVALLTFISKMNKLFSPKAH